MKRLIPIIILLTCSLSSFGQEEVKDLLTLGDYYRMILDNHPVAIQADLIQQRGELAVREARGGFDPKLVSNFDTKDFKNEDYYSLWDTYVRIPTIARVDFKAGYERNNGAFLNPENSLPENGLYYAGVSLPLGQGLINHPRNIQLAKSKLTQVDLENEASLVLNNLLLEATDFYWSWYEADEKLKLAEDNLEVIMDRFQGIRESVLNGENAAIDSIETLIQVQQWSNNLIKTRVEYRNRLIQLNNFLWGDSLFIENLMPTRELQNKPPSMEYLIDFAARAHPELRALTIQNSVLDLERKWNAEQLKPILNLNYNFLIERNGSNSETAFSANNYKGGVEFAFPLLIRKERAKLKITKTKLEENRLKTQLKSRKILNKIEQYYNKLLVIEQMIIEQEKIVVNYQRLLQGERFKFENGESSIFLINSRENQKLKADLKLIELESDYGRAMGLLKWSGGMLAKETNPIN